MGGDKEDVVAKDTAAAAPASVAADNANGGAVNDKEEKKTEDTTNGEILRAWTSSSDSTSLLFPPKAPLDSFDDNTSVDDTPYEHGFEPGDHIIRWDMLPILWPIQIHGIVLDVSDDKTTVTICDFGITTVKNDAVEKKMAKSGEKDAQKMLEEENAKFNEAIKDEGCSGGGGKLLNNNASAVADNNNDGEVESKGRSKNRLNIIILTKWSDLRKWKKVNYDGGLLGGKKGSMGEGLQKLGKQTEKLWTSVTKSFVRKESTDSTTKKGSHHVPSVRHDVNDEGYCLHHPEIQLRRRREGEGGEGENDEKDGWATVRKKCPQCIIEDCPAMMGEESPTSRTSTIVSEPFSSVEEDEDRDESKDVEKGEENSNSGTSNLSDSDSIKPPSGLHLTRTASNSSGTENDDVSTDIGKTDSKVTLEEPRTLAQMISEANNIEKRTVRKTVVKTAPSSSPVNEQKPPVSTGRRSSWRQGSFMKSVSGLFSVQKFDNKDESVNKGEAVTPPEEVEEEETDKSKTNELPRSDPPVLVLARTRFILKHGEEILPPYHIINSNSECIAVW
jgi:hypothetical protein